MSKKTFERTKEVGVHDIPEKVKGETGLADSDDQTLGKLVEENRVGIKDLILETPPGLTEETSFPIEVQNGKLSKSKNPFTRNSAGVGIPTISTKEE